MAGQWAGGCGVELGKAAQALPGELGCGSGCGIPVFLSWGSLAWGKPGLALCALSTPSPTPESWSVLTPGDSLASTQT